MIVALLAMLWTGAIGFVDDSPRRSSREILGTGRQGKLVGQCIFGLALGLYLYNFPVVSPETIPAAATTVPFFKYTIVQFAPWLYVAFVTFVVIGTSNLRI